MFSASHINAQPIFSEDFSGPTPLANWTLFNVDAKTPNTNVGVVNDAWVALSVAGNVAAVSTSWYTPAGASDDYMLTPSITLINNNYLFFNGQALDPAFPDGYQVKISTTMPTVAALTTNLLTVAAEKEP